MISKKVLISVDANEQLVVAIEREIDQKERAVKFLNDALFEINELNSTVAKAKIEIAIEIMGFKVIKK